MAKLHGIVPFSIGLVILSIQLAYAANTFQTIGFDSQLTDRYSNRQFLGKGERAYNPVARRFMQQDSWSPFGRGGLNGYIFANNNPIMRVDRNGHASTVDNLALVFAIGTAMALTDGVVGGVLGRLIQSGWQRSVLGFTLNYTKNEGTLWGGQVI